MAFTVSSLTNYVNEQSQDLLVILQFASETATYANIQTGVKSGAPLQILTNTPIPQDGTSCGFNASGDTSFSQRIITAKAVKYQDALCPRDLQTKWTQLLLKVGQKYDESNIPKVIIDDIANQINRINETCDWQGNTAAGSAFLNKYDGLRKIIDAASTSNAPNSTFNATNARSIIKSCITAIPAAEKGDQRFVFFMGYDAAETYRQALMDANLYHVPSAADQKGLYAEGSVHKIVSVHGLDTLASSGGSCIFGMIPDQQLYMGVDMEGEEEKADMWYSKDDDNVKYSFRFFRGWQIAFPSLIVKYSNS